MCCYYILTCEYSFQQVQDTKQSNLTFDTTFRIFDDDSCAIYVKGKVNPSLKLLRNRRTCNASLDIPRFATYSLFNDYSKSFPQNRNTRNSFSIFSTLKQDRETHLWQVENAYRQRFKLHAAIESLEYFTTRVMLALLSARVCISWFLHPVRQIMLFLPVHLDRRFSICGIDGEDGRWSWWQVRRSNYSELRARDPALFGNDDIAGSHCRDIVPVAAGAN